MTQDKVRESWPLHHVQGWQHPGCHVTGTWLRMWVYTEELLSSSMLGSVSTQTLREIAVFKEHFGQCRALNPASVPSQPHTVGHTLCWISLRQPWQFEATTSMTAEASLPVVAWSYFSVLTTHTYGSQIFQLKTECTSNYYFSNPKYQKICWEFWKYGVKSISIWK